MYAPFPSLDAYVAQIPEFRTRQGRRSDLGMVLRLICVAMLCGARSQVAIADWGQHLNQMWRQHLGFSRAMPSQPTIQRVLKGIAVLPLDQALHAWAEQILKHLPPPAGTLEGLARDGKTRCGSKKQGAVNAHLLSLLSHRLAVVLGQVALPDKTTAITVAEALVRMVAVTGRVVTADAFRTQRAIAQTILDQPGDYLVVVKQNLPTLAAEIATVFPEPTLLASTRRVAQVTDQHGNRVEVRSLLASTALTGYPDWPVAQQVLKVTHRVRMKRTGAVREEVASAVTSVSPDRASPAQRLKLWREHWHSEHKLHDVRDGTFAADRSSVHTGPVPQVMAAFRNATRACLRALGWANSAAAYRYFMPHPQQAIIALGINLQTCIDPGYDTAHVQVTIIGI